MTEKDDAREQRIDMEIVVDAYDEVERALGWYCHLESTLQFPFRAECTGERATSPLEKSEKVEVTGMPAETECEREMFVNVNWKRRTLAVPLSQLKPVGADDETREAVADWHYWVAQEYRFWRTTSPRPARAPQRLPRAVGQGAPHPFGGAEAKVRQPDATKDGLRGEDD